MRRTMSATVATLVLSLAPIAAPGLAGATAVRIDFDDLSPAPLFFDESDPLTDRYADLGVTFAGPDGGGGAILDANGSPGVGGFSPPNFLAFNDEALLANEAFAAFPETLSFDPPVRRVEFRIGDFFPAVVTADAYDGSAKLVDSATLIVGKALQKVILEGASIASIVVTSSGPSAALDELAFSDWGSCPHDECDAGPAMPDGCSACASAVCEEAPSCCEVSWTAACSRAAAATCDPGCLAVCGDANDDRTVSASDALKTLKTSVGTDDCDPWLCDFNGDEKTTASDAQAILRTAVAQPTTPNCPPEP